MSDPKISFIVISVLYWPSSRGCGNEFWHRTQGRRSEYHFAMAIRIGQLKLAEINWLTSQSKRRVVSDLVKSVCPMDQLIESIKHYLSILAIPNGVILALFLNDI